jgi:archaellum component FlaC
MTPLEAISFSYFLTDEEKQEWREWLTGATPEQQNELVDTLHAMWQENQKQVVPQGFGQNPTTEVVPATNVPTEPTPVLPPSFDPSPTPNFNSDPSRAQVKTSEVPVENNFLTNSNQVLSYVNSVDLQDNSKSNQSNSRSQDESLIAFGQTKYKPNPILDDPNPSTDNAFSQSRNRNQNQPNRGNQPNNQTDNRSQAKNNQISKDNKDNRPVETSPNSQSNQDQPGKVEDRTFFNVAKVREAATRKALEDIFQQYMQNREKSFAARRDFEESDGIFMDKLMQIVVNFEKVSDYFESMTAKLLEMNDRIVVQAKDITNWKNKYQDKLADLKDQIDEIRRDVDRLFRDVKDVRSENRHRYEEISQQLAAFGADAYRQDGILQRLDLVMSKVHKLESANQNTNVDLSVTGSAKQRSTSDNSAGSGKNTNGNKSQANSPTSNPNPSDNDSEKTTIDLRGIV